MNLDFEHKKYWPSLIFNEFWLLTDHLVAINQTVSNISLSINFYFLAGWKAQIMGGKSNAFFFFLLVFFHLVRLFSSPFVENSYG
jgi:hypothetical protein